MPYTRTWSKDENEKLWSVVKDATSEKEALANARRAFPHDGLSYDAICRRLRRKGYGSLPAVIFKNRPKGPAAPPPRTVKEDLELHRMRAEVASTRQAKEKLIAELSDREKQIEVWKSLQNVKASRPVIASERVGAKQRRGTPVMLCSDWHVEEHVDPKTVNGLNEYTPEIAERRIVQMADAFEWMLRDSRFDCREAVVAFLGDLFSGYIHDELAEGNFMSPVQAGAWLLPRMEQMLRTIGARCQTLSRIIVVCNDGNHGRLTRKMRCATRTANSLEWFLYYNLAERMKDDPRFEFQIADGVWNYVDLYGKTHGFLHGDVYRYLGGVGGLLIPVRRGLNEDRKYLAFGEVPRRVDHVAMGHFHTRMDIEDISVNGSMIGITPYSMSIHAPPEKPKQSWYMVDSENGKCLSAPIWLT